MSSLKRKKLPSLSTVWFMSNTETSESIVIIIVTTIKHLTCGCSVVVGESRNLIFLCEMGIGEAQLPDKNTGVPRGQAARPWSCLAPGWQTEHILTSGASPPNHSCLPQPCKSSEFLNETHNSASIVVDAGSRSQVLAAHLSLFLPLCGRQMFPYQGSQPPIRMMFT